MIPFHPKDKELFDMYPSLIMETLQKLHFKDINATISFFGPMLYFIVRALWCEKILELGHAEGYSAFYLANAIKDNATRYNTNNMYYGIDIVKTEYVRENLSKYDLPFKLLNMDSINLTKDTFKDVTFDLIFQDGCHDTEHILHELDVLYPQLKSDGKGFWISHDFGENAPAQDAYKEVKKLINKGVYNFEYVLIPEVYGICLMRKRKENE